MQQQIGQSAINNSNSNSNQGIAIGGQSNNVNVNTQAQAGGIGDAMERSESDNALNASGNTSKVTGLSDR